MVGPMEGSRFVCVPCLLLFFNFAPINGYRSLVTMTIVSELKLKQDTGDLDTCLVLVGIVQVYRIY